MVVITFETGISSNLPLLPKRILLKRLLLKRLVPKRMLPRRMLPKRPIPKRYIPKRWILKRLIPKRLLPKRFAITRKRTSYMSRSITYVLATVNAETRSVIEIRVYKAHPNLGEVM